VCVCVCVCEGCGADYSYNNSQLDYLFDTAPTSAKKEHCRRLPPHGIKRRIGGPERKQEETNREATRKAEKRAAEEEKKKKKGVNAIERYSTA